MRRRFRNTPTTQYSSYGYFSNYCGPGGWGMPMHIIDNICKEHDEDYGVIMSTGDNPYTHYNWADAKMQKRLKEAGYGSSISEKLIAHTADIIWGFKKKVTSHINHNSISPISDKSKTIKMSNPFKRHRSGENVPTDNGTSDVKTLEEHANIQQPDVAPIPICPYVRPHYFTAKLPFHLRLDNPVKSLKFSEYSAATPNKFEFLLNGIYSIPSVTTNPGYNASVMGYHVKPNGRDLYVKDSTVTTNRFQFDYYKVLGADIKITFYHYEYNGTDNERERRQCMRYGMVVDALDSTDNLNTNPLYWPETPGVNVCDVRPINFGYTMKSESFHYSPEMTRKRIRANYDGTGKPVASAELTLEGWTLTGKNPDYIDSLKVFGKALPTSINYDLNGGAVDNSITQTNYYTSPTTGGNATCDDFMEVDIQYTVQFRESKTLTQWDIGPDS